MSNEVKISNADFSNFRVLDTLMFQQSLRCALCNNPNHSLDGCDNHCLVDIDVYQAVMNELTNHSTSLSFFLKNNGAFVGNGSRTGAWVSVNLSSRGHIFKCSACGGTVTLNHKSASCPFKFCAHCGASMFLANLQK